MKRAESQASRGVSPDRLHNEVLGGNLGQLPGCNFAMVFSDGNENPLPGHQRMQTIHGALEKSALPKQRDERLGDLVGAQGPEALPAPAGHDDGVQALDAQHSNYHVTQRVILRDPAPDYN